MSQIRFDNIKKELTSAKIYVHSKSDDLRKKIPKKYLKDQIVLIVDSVVQRHYEKKINTIISLGKKSKRNILSLSASEEMKSINGVQLIIDFLLANHCSRDTVLIAVGGGVIGDLVGFVASVYMRGIPYIHIPTTLLSMVDSSIGGKTAINYKKNKNIVGAFYSSLLTWIDLTFLATLSPKDILSGLFEILKVCLIHDKKYVTYFLEQTKKINFININPSQLKKLVMLALFLKQQIVKKDFQESGKRSILNFGHTMGHALESVSQYHMPHGIAVAYGMLFAARLSCDLGLLKESSFLQIAEILALFEIDASGFKKINWNSIKSCLAKDKKNRNQEIRFVLLKEIGKIAMNQNSFTHAVTLKQIKKTWDYFSQRGNFYDG